jgi:VWFA-related protein
MSATPVAKASRVCLVAGLAAAVLVARPAARQNSSPQVVFRAGVDYVRVDVVVTDGHDRPITDLTKDDFDVVEHGRSQAINDFEFVSVPIAPRVPAPDTPPGPPPDVATNTAPSPNSRLFVMVVDDLHILESDLVPVKRVMTEFLRALSPDDEVAVVFVGHSNLSQNFTSDRGVLMRTVGRVREALGFGLDALGRFSTSDLVSSDPRLVAEYARSADLVLKNVAMSLAGSGHSRRAVVYVTGGSIVPTTPGSGGRYPTDFEDLQDVYEAARRADVPIYTLDPRGQVLAEDAVRGGIGSIGGLFQEAGLGGKVAATGGSSRPAAEAQRALIVENVRQQQERLAEVAINTGGRAFTNQSDLMRAVDEIVAENGSYYLLGYYPSPFEADGRFHTLSVKVKRPGARVRARSGYVASAVRAATDDAAPVLDAAMSAGVNVSGISLRAFAAPLSPGAKGMTTVVTVEVTYPAPSDGSSQIDDQLEMSVVALDPDAKVKASSERTLNFKATVPGRNVMTLLVDDAVDLPSQALTLRVGVASRALGKAGTVQMSLTVPKPSDGHLQLSGVVIGVSGADAPAMNAGTIESLVPFQPTPARTFVAVDTLRVFGRVFWRSKEAATVTIGIKGVVASVDQPVLTVTPGIKGGRQGAFDAMVPLRGLAPGRYVLEITGRSTSGKPVTREVPFTVREPPLF